MKKVNARGKKIKSLCLSRIINTKTIYHCFQHHYHCIQYFIVVRGILKATQPLVINNLVDCFSASVERPEIISFSNLEKSNNLEETSNNLTIMIYVYTNLYWRMKMSELWKYIAFRIFKFSIINKNITDIEKDSNMFARYIFFKLQFLWRQALMYLQFRKM